MIATLHAVWLSSLIALKVAVIAAPRLSLTQSTFAEVRGIRNVSVSPIGEAMDRAQEAEMLLHPDAPSEVTADEHLYAAWRYQQTTADEMAMYKQRGLTVVAILGIFRDEWRRYHGPAAANRLSVVAAAGAPTQKVRT